MRVATIDIGTNSVLLLIAQASEHSAGDLVPLFERATITRLGQGVDRSHALHPEAIARTLSCLKDYAEVIAQYAPDRIEVVSTSAARDAQGAGDFVDAAESILGVAPRIISGAQEAELTFLGALSGLNVRGSVAVVDIGGGSTEIVLGTAREGLLPKLSEAVSIDVGSVRLTERCLPTDPPTSEELRSVREHVRAAVQEIAIPAREVVWIGIGGTVTTLAAVHAGLSSYDAAVVHGSALTRSDVAALRARLGAVAAAERSSIPGLEPKRADIIVAGAVMVEELQQWAGALRWLVSDRGVRWGLALATCCAR
jgi:exopolyphosphatase/guanosine-5'-triphosphate,3'-diphosphate pyrophosphatase